MRSVLHCSLRLRHCAHFRAGSQGTRKKSKLEDSYGKAISGVGGGEADIVTHTRVGTAEGRLGSTVHHRIWQYGTAHGALGAPESESLMAGRRHITGGVDLRTRDTC